jgi:hypothetical protein
MLSDKVNHENKYIKGFLNKIIEIILINGLNS